MNSTNRGMRRRRRCSIDLLTRKLRATLIWRTSTAPQRAIVLLRAGFATSYSKRKKPVSSAFIERPIRDEGRQELRDCAAARIEDPRGRQDLKEYVSTC